MKKQPIDRPLSYLSLFATALNGDLSSAREQYKTLLPVKDKPSVLDDKIVNRIIRLHEEKNESVEYYKRQFKRWRKEKLTPNQLIVLQDLEEKLPLLKEMNDNVLAIAYEIQPYTIDKIMAMEPEELTLLTLSSKLKRPFEEKTTPVGRFLVFTDQHCQKENLQLTFFFKEKGTDMEMRALLAAFFQRMQKRHSGIQYGAKRMMGFFKRFVESEGIYYVIGAMAFNQDQLHEEGTSLHTHSYMRVWCDRFDDDNFPLTEVINFSNSKAYQQTASSKQVKRVQRIDQFIKELYAKGGTDEDLLMNMRPYMDDFKKVMDHSTPDQMDAFYEKYDGFYRFTKFLNDLAGAIQEGHIEVPE